MNAPLDPCRAAPAPEFSERLHRAIDALKHRLLARHEPTFPGRSEELRSAIEIAESVAWCTPFPHLFLPELAEQQIALLAGAKSPAPAFALAA